MPMFCRPLAKKAATKIKPTVDVRMDPIPLNMANDKSKDSLIFRRVMRSIKKDAIQAMNMAVATFIETPKTNLLKTRRSAMGKSGRQA